MLLIFWNQLSLYLNKLNPSEYSDMSIMEYDEIANTFLQYREYE